MSQRSSQLLPSLAVAISGALWGLFWMPARSFDQQGVNGAWLSLIFYAVATLALIPFVAMRWRETRSLTLSHVVTGLFLGSAFTLYTLALLLTTVVNALLLFYLTPLWSTLLARLILHESLGWTRLTALALGFGGLVAILDPARGLPVPRNLGDWLALIAGLSWAYGSLRSFSEQKVGMVISLLCFCLCGLLVAAIVTIGVPAAWIGPWPTMEAIYSTFPGILALAVLAFVPTNFLLIWGTQQLSPARVGILLMTELVAGTLTAALWSGEVFGPLQAIGALFIIAAGAIEVLGRGAAPAPT